MSIILTNILLSILLSFLCPTASTKLPYLIYCNNFLNLCLCFLNRNNLGNLFSESPLGILYFMPFYINTLEDTLASFLSLSFYEQLDFFTILILKDQVILFWSTILDLTLCFNTELFFLSQT